MKLQSTQIAGMYPFFFNVKMNMFSFQCFETQPSTELISNNAGLRPTLGSVSHDRNVRVAQTFLAVLSRDSHPFLKRSFIMFHRFPIQTWIPSEKLQQLPSNIFVPKDGMEFWTNALDVDVDVRLCCGQQANSCLAAFCVCQKDRSTCCLPCAAVVRGQFLSWCGREECEIHSFGTNLKHWYWVGIFVTGM